MESILIHPENSDQMKAVKAVLKALKVPFEHQPTPLPAHISSSIAKSMKQYDEGQTISIENFAAKHFSKK
ncbi:hypothetical protein GWR56_17425 [Mucilaginibacter sp. 14171R-50]|uniref:DUF2683 family protein n=1 Tax=Mucilaginibacter sp. 14171R-50 TaxID=2703789 RepID=UPI00138C65DF|nr:DUF2683 family protein [Mucilaginibacter sp. 14171R-50]QHS57232.1 hypothetical protein GWR56_17425 [Mucilaginibacter sp. 14171R-50]